MSTISETNFEQYATNPDNKALEEMQADVRDLSRKVCSFANDAAEILSNDSAANNGRKANISLLTKQMFGAVALLTLTLNLGLYFVNATFGQMIIANVGISVLHALVSMCVVSDLAKGKTYFQNKREQIQERIRTVSDYLRELMQDRQQWVNAVSELKWLSENEQIKLQMAKLEASTQQGKLDFTLALLAERTTALESLEQEQSELARDNARLLARNRELAEDLRTANQELESKELDKAHIEQDIAQLKSLEEDARSQLDVANRQSEAQETALAEKLLVVGKLQDQLQQIRQETEQMDERLDETTNRLTISEAQQLQLDQTIAILTKEVEEKEFAVQANCDKSVELLTLYETLEVEKKDLVASIESAKQELEAVEQHLKMARDDSQVLEIQIQKMQQENVELINRTVHLESQSASKIEMLASSEAQLRSMGELQKSKEAKVQEVQEELAQVERRVADFMKQLGELECLSVVKYVSEQMPLAAANVVSEVQTIAPLEMEPSPEPCEACLKYQQETANRENFEALIADLDSRQAIAQQALEKSFQSAEDAEKQVADAEQRVEMLVRKANGLSDQVQERSAELYELKQELIVTRAEVRDLEAAKQQLNLAEQELISLQTRIELTEADLTGLQTRMTELEQEYRDKAQSAHDLDHQLADLQFNRDEAQNEIRASSFELEGLRTANAELVLQCALLQEKSSKTLMEQKDVHRDLTSLQEEMDASRIALQVLTQQRNQQALDLEDLSDAVDTRRGQLAQIELEIKDLSVQKQALQNLELEIKDAQQHLETLQADGRSVASEVQVNQLLVAANGKRIHELSQESKTLEEENAIAADRLKSISDEVADAQSVSQQWQSYLTSLQAEMQECSERKTSLENQVDLLQSQTADGLLRIEELNDSLKAIQKDRQLAQEQFEKEDQRLKVIQTEAEDALSKRDWLVFQQSEVQKVLENLQSALLETEAMFAGTTLQWEQERAKLIESQNQRADLESTIDEILADQARLTDEVNALKCESESWTRLNEASRKECEFLAKEVASLELVKTNLQQVEADYNERQSAVERLDTELSDLQSKCHQLQSEIQVLESKKLDWVQLEQACEAKQTSLLILKNECADKLRIRQEIDAEITSMKSTHGDLAQLQIECDELRSSLLQMIEDRKANETVLMEVRNEMAAKRFELSELQSSLSGKKLQLEDLDENIATKNLESDELVHQLDQSRREIGKLAAFRKSTEITIGALMQQVDSLQETASVCQQDVKHAESSRAEMELIVATIEADIRKHMTDRAQLTSETTLANVLLESKKLELSTIQLQIAKSEQESVVWMQSVHQLEVDFQLALLELEAKRLALKAAMAEEVSKPDLQAETQTETEVESQVEVAIKEPSLDPVIAPQQTQIPTLAVEEDVWNSLNELTQFGQSVRVDEPVFVPKNSSTLQPSSKTRPDAWASIFSENR